MCWQLSVHVLIILVLLHSYFWGLVASIHGRCSLTKLVIIKNILSFIASLFEIIVNHSKCTIIKYDDF